jgi:hypothetical protein
VKALKKIIINSLHLFEIIGEGEHHLRVLLAEGLGERGSSRGYTRANIQRVQSEAKTIHGGQRGRAGREHRLRRAAESVGAR